MHSTAPAVSVARSRKFLRLGYALCGLGIAFGAAGMALFASVGAWTAVAFVCLPFVAAGMIGWSVVKRRSDANGPGLVIDARGIHDYTRLSGMRFLPWEHITGFVVGASDPPFEGNLFVLVHDYERYVDSLPANMQSRMRDWTLPQPSPFAIAIDQLDTDAESLLDLLKRHMNIHRPKPTA